MLTDCKLYEPICHVMDKITGSTGIPGTGERQRVTNVGKVGAFGHF